MTRGIFCALLFLSLGVRVPSSLSAMELSLEENRAQRGSAGYVDMVRVFKLYPETARAKESFADAVRQAEEGVNIRKAEILRLRGEVSTLKAERGVLAASPEAEATTQNAPVPVNSAPAADPATALAPAPSGERSTPGAFGDGGPLPPASTAAFQLPGIPGPAGAVTPAPQAPAQEAGQNAAAPAAAQLSPPPPAPSPAAQALADLDARLEKKTGELARKEEELRNIQSAAEKNLLDLESRKTEILLGKIHRVIMDVARKEGISVVVDKNNILYGHEAVDLTEKVIQALRGG